MVKLPRLQLGPKPRPWDLAGVAALLAGLGLALFNGWLARRSAGGVSSAVTLALAGAQLAVACGCLALLGKTAKEGTVWGNLAAVVGMFVGLSGVLLAAAMWVAA
jgi:hypothetical protein